MILVIPLETTEKNSNFYLSLSLFSLSFSIYSLISEPYKKKL